MQIKYRGYAIAIETKETNGGWLAKIRVGPLLSIPIILSDIGIVKGYSTQQAGRQSMGRGKDQQMAQTQEIGAENGLQYLAFVGHIASSPGAFFYRTSK